MRHIKIQELLYDFVAGSLGDLNRNLVERHLSHCDECKGTVESFRRLQAMMSAGTSPADRRPPEFWNAFVASVEQRIQQQERSRTPSLWETLRPTIMLHQRLAFSLGTGIAILAVGFLFWKTSHESTTNVASNPAVMVSPVAEQPLDQYLRRSKVLLVGLSNLPTDDFGDITLEREISRDLLREARALERTNLDPHSAAIVRDTERILIEFANIEDDDHDLRPQMEIIRGGIQQGNLLFKLRLAESVRDSTQYTFARYNP